MTRDRSRYGDLLAPLKAARPHDTTRQLTQGEAAGQCQAYGKEREADEKLALFADGRKERCAGCSGPDLAQLRIHEYWRGGRG